MVWKKLRSSLETDIDRREVMLSQQVGQIFISTRLSSFELYWEQGYICFHFCQSLSTSQLTKLVLNKLLVNAGIIMLQMCKELPSSF